MAPSASVCSFAPQRYHIATNAPINWPSRLARALRRRLRMRAGMGGAVTRRQAKHLCHHLLSHISLRYLLCYRYWMKGGRTGLPFASWEDTCRLWHWRMRAPPHCLPLTCQFRSCAIQTSHSLCLFRLLTEIVVTMYLYSCRSSGWEGGTERRRLAAGKR